MSAPKPVLTVRLLTWFDERLGGATHPQQLHDNGVPDHRAFLVAHGAL